MQDSALDFLVMIIVLGIVVMLGFNTVIPLIKESTELRYNQSYDKTVSKLEGDQAPLEYDGCISSDQIILSAMGQTFFMPKPGYIQLAGDTITVSNNLAFSPNSLIIGNQINTDLNNWFNQFVYSGSWLRAKNPPYSIKQARFKIIFDKHNPDNVSDDSYSVFILLTRVSTGKTELFRCDTGGRAIDGGGNAL